MADLKISSTDNPYKTNTYAAVPDERNTLSITSYFKLLAAQLANQDMTNPMSTSDMMNQMSQMAMVQSLTAMTESLKTSGTLTKQSYAAGMVGREVDYSGKGYQNGDSAVPDGRRTGIIDSVNFSGDEPTFHIKGDPNEYEMSAVLQVRGGENERRENASPEEVTETDEKKDADRTPEP